MVKFGPRKPSFKKSLKARTTGKAKRKMKSSVNPFYGKKGTGMIKNPKKAAYNKVYNKTTYDSLKPLKKKNNSNQKRNSYNKQKNNSLGGCLKIFGIFILVAALIQAAPYLLILAAVVGVGLLISKYK